MSTETVSKYMHLYQEIQRDIISGAYRGGSKLPSKRNMASEKNVSVITVEHAYEMLADEGYISAREKSGYYVEFSDAGFFAGHSSVRATDLTTDRTNGRDIGATGQADSTAASRAAGEAGSRQECRAEHDVTLTATEQIVGDTTVSFAMYARTARHVMSAYGEKILERSPGFGIDRLREAIAAYLQRSRDIAAAKECIIVGSGAEALYGLIVKALGRTIRYGIEDPSYMKIAQVYASEGVVTDRLRLGRDGIESGELWNSDVGALHITPYRSFPSGVTASASKRREYLRWSEAKDSYIIEDDFESEFSPLRKPEETLFSLDRGGRVIYVNTFTRTIGPFVRMAYMVIPKCMLERFEEKVGFLNCTVPVYDQYIIAEMIETGNFERHINRVRRRRRVREQTMNTEDGHDR